jgi:DHA2 family methylenomycin A resistance protein-like MFS transporter
MLIGLLSACFGLALWAVVGDAASYAVLAVAMLACGFGTSFTLTGATSTVMDAAPSGYAGTASAALNTARQTGSAAGVAISGSLIALAGLPDGVATFMAVGAVAYLLGAVLTVLCVPPNLR